jgi:hypothetical protein
MPKLGVLTVPGKSGLDYKFDAYPLKTVWTPISAVYIVTHRHPLSDGSAEHVCVQLGESQNLQDLSAALRKWVDVDRANCICVLEEESTERRNEILEDILAASLLPP